MTKHKTSQQKQLYLLFWVVIIGLTALIGWFTYLLIRPDATTTVSQVNAPATNNSNRNNNTANTNKKKNKTNANTNNSNTTNTNSANTNNDNTNADVTTTNDNAGLVEPDQTNTNNEANTNGETNTSNTNNDDGTQTITLYFPKTDSACGEVYPVERKITPSDDPYGQIIIEDMHGPADTDTGYTSAITGDIHLRQVQYTADGPLITLNEGYDALDECAKKTVDAQLIKTADVMFELSDDTAGTVEVGTVESDTNTDSDSNTDTNSDDNTNQ